MARQHMLGVACQAACLCVCMISQGVRTVAGIVPAVSKRMNILCRKDKAGRCAAAVQCLMVATEAAAARMVAVDDKAAALLLLVVAGMLLVQWRDSVQLVCND